MMKIIERLSLFSHFGVCSTVGHLVGNEFAKALDSPRNSNKNISSFSKYPSTGLANRPKLKFAERVGKISSVDKKKL